MKPELSHKRLKEVLHYEPKTGIFTWLVNKGRVTKGSRAGCPREPNGYRILCIDHHIFYEHRLAWFYMTTKWPKEINHRDLNKNNNAWSNLRLATRFTNNANVGLRKNNTSGVKGVHYHLRDRRWQARIRFNGKRLCLGSFITKKDAAKAYRAKAAELFGEFARVA